MIVQEFLMERFDGVSLFQTYSDQGLIVHKVGTEEYYDVAIDPEDELADRQYEEGDQTVEEFFRIPEEADTEI